jgi:hypothetical protein
LWSGSRKLPGRVEPHGTAGLNHLLGAGVTPVPDEARHQLCALRALGVEETQPLEGALSRTDGQQLVLPRVGVPTSPLAPHRRGGTDEGNRRAFRMMPALYTVRLLLLLLPLSFPRVCVV